MAGHATDKARGGSENGYSPRAIHPPSLRVWLSLEAALCAASFFGVAESRRPQGDRNLKIKSLIAAVLLALAGCASNTEKEQGGSGAYLDDAGITAEVKAMIF